MRTDLDIWETQLCMKEEEDMMKCKLNERETDGTETNAGMLKRFSTKCKLRDEKRENVEPPLSVGMWHVCYMWFTPRRLETHSDLSQIKNSQPKVQFLEWCD